MAAASTFSYAQAAKGQGTSPANASPNPASQPAQAAPSAAAAAAAPEAATEPSPNSRAVEHRHQTITEKQDAASTIGSESDFRSETTHDRPSETRRDEESGRLSRPWRRTEKDTRSSSTATRSVDEQGSRRPRKGRKSRASSDKQSSDQTPSTDQAKHDVQEAPKMELSEAPIPSVNIWTQRKEQQAKVHPSPPEVVSNGAVVIETEAEKHVTDPIPAATTRENMPISNGLKSNRKTAGESSRSDRNGSRGARVVDKDGKTDALPPVGDAALWPTPETAVKEEHKKPALNSKPGITQEKELQDDSSQSRRQKDKWVAYDYVPTVNFETQIPHMRNPKSRGGARNTNGGGRIPPANNGQPSEKPAAHATSASTRNEPRDRGKESGNGPSRPNSQPPASKRASVDGSSVFKEQKKATTHGGNEKSKEAVPSQSTQPSNASVTQNARYEGRPERGRGGYRGRGAHHVVNVQPHQHNGASFQNHGSLSGRGHGPYSPTSRQGSQGFVPTPQRGGRSRGGAGNNYHRMSLPNGATRLPPVQTTFGPPYEYPVHSVSAVPFAPVSQYWDDMVLTVLKNQIEYYFSIENLCKDMYLRKRMDSQGFVTLHFIAAFKRIRELTQDMAMIRAVCEASVEVDFAVGEDDIERLRRRAGWESFILPMEDRDDFARTHGPQHVTFKNRPFSYGPPFNGLVPMSYGPPPPGAFSPQGDGGFTHFPDGAAAGQIRNNLTNVNGDGATQLSADVPAFSPSATNAAGRTGSGVSQTHTSGISTGNPHTNGVRTE